MNIVSKYLIYSSVLISSSLSAQVKKPLTDDDKKSLEGIIVEKYYVNDGSQKDTSSTNPLPKGAVTYRIYVDMKPGYTLQAVFGVTNHELNLKTTTKFFNTYNGGDATGDKIDDLKINNPNVAFDSWITMGAATDEHFGIPKTEDTDGSIIKTKGFEKVDGLIKAKIKPVTYFGLDLTFFNNIKDATSFTTDNASWAIFGGIKGPTDDNKVLIAQLTTDGKLSN
jgi:hypothetical protein